MKRQSASILVQLDVQILDQACVFFIVVAVLARELLGAAADRLQAAVDTPLTVNVVLPTGGQVYANEGA